MTNTLQEYKRDFVMALTKQTAEAVNWQQESEFALQALQRNDYLAKIASANQNSLRNAIINIGAIGISLNPARKHAYLVPRDNMVCLDISYMGLIHIAVDSGAIEWAQAKLVYSCDSYQNKGIDKAPDHQYNAFGNRGDVVGAYCVAKLPDGSFVTEEMDRAQLEQVRATSKAKNGAWANWTEEMMRKTVVKRASKYWISNRLSTAVEALNQHEGLIDAQKEEKEVEAIEMYPEDRFAENFPKWQLAVEEDRIDVAGVLAMVQSRFTLTDEQYNQIVGMEVSNENS